MLQGAVLRSLLFTGEDLLYGRQVSLLLAVWVATCAEATVPTNPFPPGHHGACSRDTVAFWL